MPAIIRLRDVEAALRPRLGSDMVEGTDVAEQCAHILRSFAAYKDTYRDLADRLGNAVFNVLYGTVGPAMTVRLDNGESRRIRISELSEIADDVLYAFFDSLTVYSVNYRNLKDYSLHANSLSALRVLYQKYDEFQSPEEKALMARIIREGYAPARYESWLPPEG